MKISSEPNYSCGGSLVYGEQLVYRESNCGDRLNLGFEVS